MDLHKTINDIQNFLVNVMPEDSYIQVNKYSISYDYIRIAFAPCTHFRSCNDGNRHAQISFSYCLHDNKIRGQMYGGTGGNYLHIKRSFYELMDVPSFIEIPFEEKTVEPDQIIPELKSFMLRYCDTILENINILEGGNAVDYYTIAKEITKNIKSHE